MTQTNSQARDRTVVPALQVGPVFYALPVDGGRFPARTRAVWLEVQPVAPGRFLVRGGRADHMVDIDGGWVRCDCPDAAQHGDQCKHALCVRLHNGDSKAVRALRQLVARPAQRGAA